MSSIKILIARVNQDPQTVIPQLSTQELSNLVEYADQAYYLGDTNPFTDAIYDELREKLVTLTGPVTVTRTPITGRKVKLPYHMGSMDKVKSGEPALRNWLSQYPAPYITSVKLDGVSALYTRDSYKQAKLYTRGDGIIGQDISFLLPHLKLPSLGRLNAVRGEIIIPKEIFSTNRFVRPNTGIGSALVYYENPRNAVSGLVNSLEDRYNKELANSVDFVAYEHIAPTVQQPSLSQQLEQLRRNGFQVAQHQRVTSIDEAELSQLFDQYLLESPYEIDGVIIQIDRPYQRNISGNPEYARAYKKNLDILTATTTVVDVEWNLSRTKFLKPVLLLEPVIVDNVTISRATGYNAKFIVDNKIGPGAVVKIVRSGGVIPKVLEIIQPATSGQGKLPDTLFKWGSTAVDIILDQSGDESTPELEQLKEEAKIKAIAYFLATLKVEKMGEKTVEKIFQKLKQDHQAPNLGDFLRLSIQQIRFLGPKTSENIIQNIRTSLQYATPNLLAAASGLFGRGIGEKKLDMITDTFPNFWTRYSLPFNPSMIQQDLLLVDGVAGATAQLISNNYEQFYRFYLGIRDLLNPSKMIDGPQPYTLDHLAKTSGMFPYLQNDQLEDLLIQIDFSQLTNNGFAIPSQMVRPASVNTANYAQFLAQLPVFFDYIKRMQERYSYLVDPIVRKSNLVQPIETTSVVTPISVTQVSTPSVTYRKTMPKLIVLTDLKNKAKYEKTIKELGGKTGSSVTHSTDLVVIGHSDVSSIKRKRAEEKGIPVITLDEFEYDYLTPISTAVTVMQSNPIPYISDSVCETICQLQSNDSFVTESGEFQDFLGSLDEPSTPRSTLDETLAILDQTLSLQDILLILKGDIQNPQRKRLVDQFRLILEPVVPDRNERMSILKQLAKSKMPTKN